MSTKNQLHHLHHHFAKRKNINDIKNRSQARIPSIDMYDNYVQRLCKWYIIDLSPQSQTSKDLSCGEWLLLFLWWTSFVCLNIWLKKRLWCTYELGKFLSSIFLLNKRPLNIFILKLIDQLFKFIFFIDYLTTIAS